MLKEEKEKQKATTMNRGWGMYRIRRLILESKKKQRPRKLMKQEWRLNKTIRLRESKEYKEQGSQDMVGVGETPILMDNIGFWNTRGLNNPAKQREIQIFMHNARVGVFGLLETKVKRAKAQQVSLHLCQGWAFNTNLSQHPKGGIWLLWNPMIYGVNIIRVTAQLIHCEIQYRGTGHTFHVTMIYAFNDATLRRELWQTLKEINGQIKGPWAIMGDFNCVLQKEERIGSPVTMAEIRDFKKYVEECELKNLKSTGAFFTWTNKQSGGDKGNKGQKKMFKYYNMWSMATDFKEKIRPGWKTEKKGTKMYELVGKLHRIKHTLQQLNKDKFNEVERKADEAMMRLQNCQENIQKDPYNTVLIEEEMNLSQECRSWCKAREQYLRQKSKIQWLKQGDMNTKNFHSMMKARRNSNRILAVDNTEGQHVTDLEEIAKTFIVFYEGLLGTKQQEID
ncbi:PREDICTED: uncharacterized protein LOC109243992 [Nicotiana attenuata]|uniref:uncharacterized protein LOC109243992 n=1 Tax=Nicotiana attenuata TaxID=49451 RepID=UPI0009050678|nr:PREDICTED: uncharacterized protein LOC109243992 [Nicotiana attenuata]